MPGCSKCGKPAVIKYAVEPRYLCQKHFIQYFERKVFHAIRAHGLLEKGEKVSVAASGGKDSLSVLSLLVRLARKRNDALPTAIAVDEGIHGYRDEALEDLKRYCSGNGVELKVFSYREEFGASLDEMLAAARAKKVPLKSCSICGVLRRYLLNKKPRELGFDKLVTGHNLDDEAQTFLLNLLRGDVWRSARLGPKTGVAEECGFVQRVKPLYFCTERETATYAFLKGFKQSSAECPNTEDAYRQDLKAMLNGLESKYPGTKATLLRSGLEFMALARDSVKEKRLVVSHCSQCGEPSAGAKCKACQVLSMIGLVKNAS